MDKLYDLLAKEIVRQNETIDLIASENYVSASVRAMVGSVFMNKYVEGYPGARYYAGCSVVDQVEQETIDRYKKLFQVEHVNVQPHSGTQANFAVYLAFLKPNDLILSMNLSAGGHLTHGHSVNFSGKMYQVVSYGVDANGYLDYAQLERLAHEHKPRLIIAGASSYSRTIDFEKIKKVADSVSAIFMADISHIAGLIIAGLHPSPVGYADVITTTTHKTLQGPRGALIMTSAKYGSIIDRAVMPGTQGGAFMHEIAAKGIAAAQAMTQDFIEYQKQIILNARVMAQEFIQRGYTVISGGTDTHLFVIDIRNKAVSGKYIEQLLERYGIIVNRNAIPFDTLKPMLAGGIRIGTPVVTARGLKEADCIKIVAIIDRIIVSNHTLLDSSIIDEINMIVKLMKPVS